MDINTPYITDSEHLAILNRRNTGQMQYTFMNDFLSKYGFQKDLYALRGLLSALLHIDIEEITDITILNPIEPGNELTDKECILDIKLELNHSKIINVEIQSRHQDFWPETGDFYSEYRLLHSVKHTEYSSKFEIRVLLLNQLENASDEEKKDPNGLYHWARLFNASSWEEVKMIAQDNPMMSSFVGTVMELTAEEKVAQACEMRRRYLNDIASYEYEIEQAKENAAKAREEEVKANENAARAREGEAKAREEINRIASELKEKDAEIAQLRELLAKK